MVYISTVYIVSVAFAMLSTVSNWKHFSTGSQCRVAGSGWRVVGSG